jgi:hypothetical protein
MITQLDLARARELFGTDLIMPERVAEAIGDTLDVPGDRTKRIELPIAAADLQAARRSGALLVYRPARLKSGSAITLSSLHERFMARGAPAPRFRSEDPWFAAEGFASTETPEEGWALVTPAPWRSTLNVTYDQASLVLDAAGRDGAGWRRRRAVEIAFDCLVVAVANRVHLLASTWDWSSSTAADGGLVNIGGFSERGLDVLSYSKAVKHGALGVCPTLVGK